MADKFNKIDSKTFERVREDKVVITLDQIDHQIELKNVEVNRVQGELQDLKKLRKDLAAL